MYGSKVRSTAAAAAGVGLLGATLWHPRLADLDHVSPNKPRKRPPRPQSKVMAKRSFGARLLSLLAALVLLPWCCCPDAAALTASLPPLWPPFKHTNVKPIFLANFFCVTF